MNVQQRIQEVYDTAFPILARSIADGEELPPGMVVLFEDGNAAAESIDFIPKEQWAGFQSYLLGRDEVAAVGIVTEGWAVKAKAGEELDTSIPPSRNPNRTEVVTFVFTVKDGGQMFSICDIERPANLLVKAPLQHSDNDNRIEGRAVPTQPQAEAATIQ